jgi:hypothetical protein
MGVACGTYGRREKCYRVLWGDVRKRDHLEDPGVDGNMILKRFFKKRDGEAWTGSIGLRIGTGGGHL